MNKKFDQETINKAIELKNLLLKAKTLTSKVLFEVSGKLQEIELANEEGVSGGINNSHLFAEEHLANIVDLGSFDDILDEVESAIHWMKEAE